MSKFRQFSIVLHNVHPDHKTTIENHFRAQNPTKLVVALEPYPESEGFHCHVFVSFKSDHSFKKMLSSTKTLSTHVITEKPEGEERDWGRVQVDQMRGNFSQATAYLTEPQKKKEVDPNLTTINPQDEDQLHNYQLAVRLLAKVYFYPNYGEYLTAQEYIQRETSKDRPIDPFYSQMLYHYEKGLPR